MANKPPYFPFYCNDFTADGKVEAMTTEQVGAYILLLCKAWSEEPPGTLPQDDTVLARWARLTPERWTEVRAGVLAAFSSGTDNRWHQKRMREEYAKVSRLIRSKSVAGKKGAESRWKNGTANGSANGSANGKSMAADYDSDSESSRGGGSGGRGPDPPAENSLGPHPGQTWPAFLADEWAFYFRGTSSAERDPYRLSGFFESMLARGIAAREILDRIRSRPTGERTEPTWEFAKRWGNGNGHATNGTGVKPGGGVGSSTRIRTPQRSLDALAAKTIVSGEAEPAACAAHGANGAYQPQRNGH